MSNTAAVGVLIFHEIKSIKKEIKTSLNTKLKGSLTINLVPNLCKIGQCQHWNDITKFNGECFRNFEKGGGL